MDDMAMSKEIKMIVENMNNNDNNIDLSPVIQPAFGNEGADIPRGGFNWVIKIKKQQIKNKKNVKWKT